MLCPLSSQVSRARGVDCKKWLLAFSHWSFRNRHVIPLTTSTHAQSPSLVRLTLRTRSPRLTPRVTPTDSVCLSGARGKHDRSSRRRRARGTRRSTRARNGHVSTRDRAGAHKQCDTIRSHDTPPTWAAIVAEPANAAIQVKVGSIVRASNGHTRRLRWLRGC